jgi:putative hydrolase of the HAD superfamily
VLDELREADMALAILTNGSVTGQEAKIAHLGLDGRVDAVIVSEAVGAKKPDRRVFDATLESLDADAADAIYIGDHPVNDVQGAIGAGWTAIWLRGWHDWPAELPAAEHVIDFLVEIPPLLDTL